MLSHDRHGTHPRGRLLEPVGRCRVDDPQLREGVADLRAPLRTHPVADDVAIEQRGRAGRTSVGDGDERVVVGGHPHDDVGEGEVGQKLTISGEPVQPLHVRFAGPALGVHEIAERRHVSRLPTRRAGCAPSADARRTAARPLGCRGRLDDLADESTDRCGERGSTCGPQEGLRRHESSVDGARVERGERSPPDPDIAVERTAHLGLWIDPQHGSPRLVHEDVNGR